MALLSHPHLSLFVVFFCSSFHVESPPKLQNGEDKGEDSSPAITSAEPNHSGQSQSQKMHHPLSLNNKCHSLSPTHVSTMSLSANSSRISSPTQVKSVKHRRTSQSVSPPRPPLKRRKISPLTHQYQSPLHTSRKNNSGLRSKPIRSISPLSKSANQPSKPVISPIRLASSGESFSDTSPPSPKMNGLPEQYRRNFNKNYNKQQSSGHHHHRHHPRRSGKVDRDKHQRRHKEEGRSNRLVLVRRPKTRQTEQDHFSR